MDLEPSTDSGGSTGSGPSTKCASPVCLARRRGILKWCLLAIVCAATLAIDLVSKYLAEASLVAGETHRILPFFYLQLTSNDGVAFGFLSGKTSIIIVANIVALLVVGVYVFVEHRPLLAGIGGGMVVGGSLGNLVQRIVTGGHVTDFLKFPHWPNFNLADVFIDVGIAVIFLGVVVEAVREWRAGRRTPVSR